MSRKFIKSSVIILSVFLFIGFSSKELSQFSTGWTVQFTPDTSTNHIKDIFFIDSITGFLISGDKYLFKTTNAGNNWFLNYNITTNDGFQGIKFLNKDTGIALCAFSIRKTTNQGLNWIVYDFQYYDYIFRDFQMFGNDTIWASGSNVVFGKIFLSTNGGANWQYKFQGNSNSLYYIYFFNKLTGYCSEQYSKVYKTTNGGENWFLYLNEGMNQIYFVDSLTGWRTYDSVKKTTNGGLNWITQSLPKTNLPAYILRFSVLNKDTIWGVGGSINFYYPTGARGIIYKTTNGGLNWGYQLPDTSFNYNGTHFYQYRTCQFINKRNGWCYNEIYGGVHTTSGGSDTTFFTSISNNESKVTTKFILFQNYPNPFNPTTTIAYYLYTSGYVELKVYNILGKDITTIVKRNQKEGNYEYDFDGNNISSGIFFFSLTITDKQGNVYRDTKKMLLVK